MEYKFNGPDGIEKKWQDNWKNNNRYKVSNNSDKPKYYVLDMFPYPSGAGLHVGHPLGYIASDIYSRYKRLKGFNVLHPMGFDSFGLPAEQYAIETGQHPAETTKKNIATFKAQLDKIGFCYDWEREVRTSDPSYYKWTQWIFLQLYNSYFCNTQKKARPISELVKKYETKGCNKFTAEQWNSYSKKEQEEFLMNRRLAFSKFGEVNWCEALGTVLANDEVVNGVSERGGFPVVKKKMRQWYLRITAYADRLLEGLETVDFSDSMKEMQRNWIGRSEGAEMDFKIVNSESSMVNETLRVYTTRPDTVFGVDFMVVAPELELIKRITTQGQKTAVEEYIAYVKSRSDVDRMAEKKITGCFTGAYAVNTFDGKEIPVWISEYVLAGYGTGAIMAVPCGDERDFKFAKHFNIPITNIIGSYFNGEEANPTKEAILENSGFLNGMLMKDAIGVAVKAMEEKGIGIKKVNYKMRDAGFSRQRYWGEPFPIIWSDGIAIPLDAAELPLELPHVDKYGPGPEGEGPLANLKEWVNLSPILKEKTQEDLTPYPSPKERENEEPAANGKPYGYVNSTADEWRKTLEFAKQNRTAPTAEEDKIWQAIRDRKITGHKFRRQHPIAGYIPDFVCLEKKLIVEIDGGYHTEEEQQLFDKARENWLAEQGFTMIRFTNFTVNNALDTVLEDIEQALLDKETITEFEGTNSANSPLPWRGAGGEVKRETSTMPGYAGSSWYFLRYMDPNNSETFCDRKASDYWNQVDLYIGGTEHAVGHLLYSRLWTKVLYDLGYIGFDEPFKKLVNQGMITGKSFFLIGNKYTNSEKNFSIQIIKSDGYVFPKEIEYEGQKLFANQLQLRFRLPNAHRFLDANDRLTKRSYEKYMTEVENPIKFQPETNIVFWDDEKKTDSGEPYLEGMVIEKMSKSKFNVENPDELCDKYGADTFRMYEMFLGPVEQSKPWDTKGIEGVHRFLRKLWRLFFDDIKGKVWNTDKATDAELKILHRTIKKIEEDTERFSFNTAVSTFMICVNELTDIKCHKKEVLGQLLILLTPYAPHIAEELWHQLGSSQVSSTGGDFEGASILDATYPAFNPALLVETTKEYPVSINGKVRTNINLALDLQQAEVEKLVVQNEVVQKWLEGKAPKKIIYVKNKMVNVVI